MAIHPIHPAHPERICWGCDQYCAAEDLTCGKDTVRTPHPVEIFGADWNEPVECEEPDALMRSRAIESLQAVLDPELGLNIVDLGVLHELSANAGALRVTLTLTSPACPLVAQIKREVRAVLLAVEGVKAVEVVELWEPPWTPERMSAAARRALGIEE